MGYSLLSKFRGAWLGSIFGQQLVNLGETTSEQEQKVIDLLNEQIEIFEVLRQPDTSHILRNLDYQLSASELTLKILPIILYYHDDWSYLRDFLTAQSNNLSQSVEAVDDVLIWSYVVRLALRGKLILPGLTDLVVMRTELQSELSVEWLKAVEMSFISGCNTTEFVKQLSCKKDRAIPLSLFCFLNNAQDFSLVVGRASSLESQAANTIALSGFISGAYNGWNVIPISWRQKSRQNPFFDRITIQTEKMIGNWIGLEQRRNQEPTNSVITPPQIVQIRQNLRIVSQQEYE